MKILRKMALPCGLVGGVWGLLAPALVLLPVAVGATPPFPGEQGKTEMMSMVEAGVAGDALPVLSFIALMGLLGLLAMALRRRKPRLGRIFLWVSASAILVISLVSIFSLGLFSLPASILLILAAVGMSKKKETPPLEAR